MTETGQGGQESFPPPLDDQEFRNLLSSWASGVSVITAMHEGVRHGCTVSAFSALSLRPMLVLVCLDLQSNTLAAVRESGELVVNILAEHQHEVSDSFAVKASADAEDKFLTAPHQIIGGHPVLNDCVGYMVCELYQEVEGGDHAILIAKPIGGEADHERHPLVHFRRNYHTIGSK
jgi:flavin reductase (DIM6/NTAB) family NADH-FMN oxidoreductase RutF